MQLSILLLLTCSIAADSYALHTRPALSHLKHNVKRPTELNLITIDSDTVSQISTTVTNPADAGPFAFVGTVFSTFIASVTTRLGAIIIGNILAAAFVKYVTNFFRQKTQEIGSDISKSNNGEGSSVLSNVADNVNLRDLNIPSDAWFKLLVCILIDLIGDSSFAIPGLGELEDFAWAPISAFSLRALFGSNAIAGLDFIKEALPFTDIVPIATITWLLTYVLPENPVGEALGIQYDERASRELPNNKEKKNDNVIDV